MVISAKNTQWNMKFVSGAMGFVSGGIRVKIVEPISRGENG